MTQNDLSIPQVRERARAQGIVVSERAVRYWFDEGKIAITREETHGSRTWRYASSEVVDAFLATLGGREQADIEATSRPTNTPELASC